MIEQNHTRSFPNDPDRKKLAISFVVDSTSKFQMQAWNLLVSLRSSKHMEASGVQVFAHCTPDVPSGSVAFFERLGAIAVPMTPFGQGPGRYCNKIQQLTSGALNGFETVILLDADVFVVGDLTSFCGSETVQAAPVRVPNPDAGKLNRLWQETDLSAGLKPKMQRTSMSFFRRSWSVNFNGGLYVIPGKFLENVALSWAKWARFCLSRAKLLGNFDLHSDQIGFALAIAENRIPTQRLDLSWNFPLQEALIPYRWVRRRKIDLLHYHSTMDNHGRPDLVGVDWIDQQVATMRSTLDAERRQAFDQTIFWNFRYETDPALGSGVGSRGEVLEYKRSLLGTYFRDFAKRAVLDVGCGDIEMTRGFEFTDYTGIDRAHEAIKLAREKEPNRHFSTEPVDKFADRSMALVLCLDVLIHVAEGEEYHKLVRNLVRVCQEKLIVAAYDRQPPDIEGKIIFFHESIIQTLGTIPRVAKIEKIGEYRDTVVVCAEMHPD